MTGETECSRGDHFASGVARARWRADLREEACGEASQFCDIKTKIQDKEGIHFEQD